MPVDPITTCLERLTDYRQFERLCCALLSDAGYPRIDPMGGTGDDGLDAIVRNDGQGGVTAFAFTVRNDWFTKLKSDSSRVAKTQKGVKTLVYACTSSLSAAEKNKAYTYIRETYFWHLDLFDIEGLRAHLVNRHDLITHHPSIFDPRYFPPAQPSFAQDYIKQHAKLLNWLNNTDEDLATEIDARDYNALCEFLAARGQAELICYDLGTRTALEDLHATILSVWRVISDEHYIPSGWRVKFNNRERIDVNVQAILREKKAEILPLLAKMQTAIRVFLEISRR